MECFGLACDMLKMSLWSYVYLW